MIEYEVTLEVDASIADEYLAWLRTHVAALRALPGFIGATLWRVSEPESPGRRLWCARYQLCDAAALATYLADHAPAMRADGIARFGDTFRATRRIMAPVSPASDLPDSKIALTG